MDKLNEIKKINVRNIIKKNINMKIKSFNKNNTSNISNKHFLNQINISNYTINQDKHLKGMNYYKYIL